MSLLVKHQLVSTNLSQRLNFGIQGCIQKANCNYFREWTIEASEFESTK